MRVAVLFSGGKDSVFAAFWAMAQGFEPVLLTVRPPEYSMMFHHPNIHMTERQAGAMGLEIHTVKVTEQDWKEKVRNRISEIGSEGIVTGAVESEYQRRRVDAIGEELGIPTYAPLWHKGKEAMAEMLEYFEIYVSAVSAEGLGPEFLGEPLKKLLDSSKPAIHLFLEGGEGETFVANAPFFKKRIEIKKWKKQWDGIRGTAEVVSS
ncbi:diphthine--ammonia ligase [Candidatus Micrarchaeota archaeon]|nr:diphthine--ammonia ligase [Candidatus Micrarchaeota archaeon]